MNRAIKSFGAAMLLFGTISLGGSAAQAQTYNSYSGGYNTGYGTVYGSFGLAMATQNIYQSTQMQIQRLQQREMMIKQFGRAAVEKSEREAAAGKTSSSGPKIAVTPPPVVRNYGIFRPDAKLDTSKAFADALGETVEEKELIRNIYVATKNAYETEAASMGMKNNIAGAMAFFTATAMFIHNGGDQPSDEAVANYARVVNAAIDEMPEFASVSNKDKQGFHNMLIGFAGLLYAGYLEGQQTENAETLAAYKKLSGMLIEMVLKTDPKKLQLENGQIVLR